MKTLTIMLALIVATPAAADPGPRFIRLAPGAPALLYQPEIPGPKARIAVLAMHSSADYLTHLSCTELVARGYTVLCANNPTSKSGVSDDGVFDRVLTDVKAGVVALRAVPGVERVVLFGHSGGSAVMTGYQMVAENGLAACRGPDKIHQCPDTLAGMPPADGVVLADPNWGQGALVLFSTDPAVQDEESGMRRDPALDLFNPANGFDPKGARYTPDFIRRFQQAAATRQRTILARALDRRARIESGEGRFSDDEPFVVPGASFLGWNNKLYAQDVRLLSRSVKPWPLVRADGSITTGIIHTVRPPLNPASETHSLLRGALKTTVRNYLALYALRTTADFGFGETSEIHGIQWQSNYANAPGNVRHIRAPLLAMGMTGGWEALAAELIHEQAASPDKSLMFVEGATHVFTPCTACERTPGQYGDTVKLTFDQIDRWLSAPGRF